MANHQRVLLTGATGFIGQRVAAALLAQGLRVTALVRSPLAPAAQRLAAAGVRLAVGDLTDRESLREPLQDADLLLHAAGMYELGVDGADRARMSAVNVTGTDHLLGLALELNCPRVLMVSSCAVYGDTGNEPRDEAFERHTPPASHYDATMSEARRLALQWTRRGLPLVLACPNAVVGPNDHSALGYLLRLHVNHLMPPVAACPDAVLCPVHVDDLAQGLVAAALFGRTGQTYNLGGPACSLKQLFGLWQAEVPGGAAVRWWLPAWSSVWLYTPLGPLLRLAGLSAFLSGETASQAAVSLNCSSAKAERELGWQARGPEALWRDVGAAEIGLLARRRGQALGARLRPLH
ncbi:nucleoside-diphosphate-sugar epimerase [Burkholderiales bacterium JOSHI_001]|nr:nucleoside-diphosphate-sugar epimerase [Burkholderiales bacterium JOSHI_001]